MKKILITMVLTLVTTVGGVTGFLVEEGNIKVVKVEQEHCKQVYLDGELIEDRSFSEFFGYKVVIDLNDGTYIGK